ncbi:MAG: GNAT family N-acetyltransferase [Cyclobacteriaceae bacterium]|nr:GNAT family N-acetyltransferase [Cyclobacteriaceae bacterium]
MRTLHRTDITNLDFQHLVKLLDADLAMRDGEDHAFYAPFNTSVNLQAVVVAYENNQPVGCGAFKAFGESQVEIKRMFVLPDFRGRGVALHILQELETWARESSYTTAVLETGKKQPEAIRLYQKAGYHIIANFGPYVNVENSVCMEKHLT